MWRSDSRATTWKQLSEPWDLVVIGGGITGAGILNQAAQQGLRALLVEARDFAYGTSSRSTKLVHGGLRYLRQGQFRLTRESVRERERLMREAPGLVEDLGFSHGSVPGRQGAAVDVRRRARGVPTSLRKPNVRASAIMTEIAVNQGCREELFADDGIREFDLAAKAADGCG